MKNTKARDWKSVPVIYVVENGCRKTDKEYGALFLQTWGLKSFAVVSDPTELGRANQRYSEMKRVLITHPRFYIPKESAATDYFKDAIKVEEILDYVDEDRHGKRRPHDLHHAMMIKRLRDLKDHEHVYVDMAIAIGQMKNPKNLSVIWCNGPFEDSHYLKQAKMKVGSFREAPRNIRPISLGFLEEILKPLAERPDK